MSPLASWALITLLLIGSACAAVVLAELTGRVADRRRQKEEDDD